MNIFNNILRYIDGTKGFQGYINKKRIIESIKTILMFGISLIIYFAGYSMLGTNKSVWSIIAVLGILPASKCAVGMIMFLRFKSVEMTEYKQISESMGNIPALYELIFTSSEKAYYVKALACSMSTVAVLADGKGKKFSTKELEKHILDCISREGMKNVTVKVYTDTNEYCSRLNEMNTKLYSESDTSYEKLFALFLSITL